MNYEHYIKDNNITINECSKACVASLMISYINTWACVRMVHERSAVTTEKYQYCKTVSLHEISSADSYNRKIYEGIFRQRKLERSNAYERRNTCLAEVLIDYSRGF